jgi:hypothetical protein
MPLKDKQARREADRAYYLKLKASGTIQTYKRAYYLLHRDQALNNYRKRYPVVQKQGREDKLRALSLCGPEGKLQCSWPECVVIDPDMLTLDHIEDDGYERRLKGERKGLKLYSAVCKGLVTGLQTLCANHNLKKELIRRRNGVSNSEELAE